MEMHTDMTRDDGYSSKGGAVGGGAVDGGSTI